MFFIWICCMHDVGLSMIQHVKKNRDPRWEEEFQFMLEEPPTNDRLHVEVCSVSSRIGLLHPKVLFQFYFIFYLVHKFKQECCRMKNDPFRQWWWYTCVPSLRLVSWTLFNFVLPSFTVLFSLNPHPYNILG